jgi:hypothetical protein
MKLPDVSHHSHGRELNLYAVRKYRRREAILMHLEHVESAKNPFGDCRVCGAGGMERFLKQSHP